MHKDRYPCLLIILAGVLVFWPVIGFEFLKYDDTINVSKNSHLLFPSGHSLIYFWRHFFLDLYIPVTYTVWLGLAALSSEVFGRLDAGLFHLANMLIHILSALLVYELVQRLYRIREGAGHDPAAGRWPALLAGLVFCLHPLQVESVCWITGFKDVLGGFLGLLATRLYLATVQPEGYRLPRYGLATVVFMLAVLAKPSAVAVPLMIFFMVLWTRRQKVVTIIQYLLPWLILAAVIILLTRAAQPAGSAGLTDYPWLIRPMIALDAFFFYVYKLIWPAIMLIDYGRTPARVLQLGWGNPFWLMAPVLAGLLYLAENRRRWLLVAAIFAAGLLPVSGLLPFAFQRTSTVADRYVYLAMMAAGLAAAELVYGRQQRLIFGLCLVLVLAWGVKSSYQCRLWHNTGRIMEYTLRYNPDSFRANLNYGIALADRAEFARALSYYQKARRLRPDDPVPRFNLGVAYAGLGRTALWRQQYEYLENRDPAKAERLARAAARFEALR
ncbi:MAG: hypothetical protein ACOCPQ_02115 [Desulfosudaceae bacterium]